MAKPWRKTLKEALEGCGLISLLLVPITGFVALSPDVDPQTPIFIMMGAAALSSAGFYLGGLIQPRQMTIVSGGTRSEW